MPDLPISGLPAATTPLGGTEEVALVQGGVTSKAAVSDIQIQIPNLPTATLPLNPADNVLVVQSGDNKKATVADVSFNINTLPAGTTPVSGTEPIPIYQSGQNKQVTINDVQIDITNLPAIGIVADTDVFVAEKPGTGDKFKYTLGIIKSAAASTVTLQSAYNNGSTINVTTVNGVAITSTSASTSEIFKITDAQSRNSFVVDANDTRIKSNYDLEFQSNQVAPLPTWGNFGATTLLKWSATNRALRAGSSSTTQFDAANIGDYSYGFGSDILLQGSNQFGAGEDLTLDASSTNSHSIGTNNSISNATNSIVIGTDNTVSGNSSTKKYVIGNNINLAGLGGSNIIAMGRNYSGSNFSQNYFSYYDGSSGQLLDNPQSQSFNVRVGNEINLKAPEVKTTADQFIFDKKINSSGTYTPCVVHVVGVDGPTSVGSPLTTDSSVAPFVLRQITAADPNDQPIVAIALESNPGPGGADIKVCGASLVCLNKDSSESFSQGDPIDKSNFQNGAVKPAAGVSGAFAVAAEFSGIGGGVIYAWLKRSEL